ncbi:MAG: GNAT family N-acetyltransferase [Mycoplasma sp.]
MIKKITSDRFSIRPWKISDAQDMYEACSDFRISNFTGFKAHKSLSETITILNSLLYSKEVYAIVLNENNKAIGSIGLHKRENLDTENKFRNFEIGYWLSYEFQNKGIMTEAVNALCEYVFKNNIADIIWVSHADFNDKSKSVITKCGFKYSHFTDGLNRPSINKEHRFFHYVKTNKEIFEKIKINK